MSKQSNSKENNEKLAWQSFTEQMERSYKDLYNKLVLSRDILSKHSDYIQDINKKLENLDVVIDKIYKQPDTIISNSLKFDISSTYASLKASLFAVHMIKSKSEWSSYQKRIDHLYSELLRAVGKADGVMTGQAILDRILVRQ